jgi:hypothetical protein
VTPMMALLPLRVSPAAPRHVGAPLSTAGTASSAVHAFGSSIRDPPAALAAGSAGALQTAQVSEVDEGGNDKLAADSRGVSALSVDQRLQPGPGYDTTAAALREGSSPSLAGVARLPIVGGRGRPLPLAPHRKEEEAALSPAAPD